MTSFRIADTFIDSLARLTGDEQKAVKTTVFDLNLNPAHPGMKFHRLDKARDKKFWSVRVGADIRLIVHKDGESLLVCYVGHHDPAYQWAERRRIEVHPQTGAVQMVEVRETIQEIRVPKYIEVEEPAPQKPKLFAHLSNDDLLGYGVPLDWLADVRAADEDALLALAEHLPQEAAEALLEIAVGGDPDRIRIEAALQAPVDINQPSFLRRRLTSENDAAALRRAEVTEPLPLRIDPFAHPDAQRRFRLIENVEELERAFDFPWDKWSVFLHPAQRDIVERDYSGPARVSGTAGTGKTVVALHRAVHLARANPDSRVLLTTFSDPLANALRNMLRRLVSNEPHLAERLDVHSVQAIARRLAKPHLGDAELATPDAVAQLIEAASAEVGGHRFSQRFLITEWEQVVDAWQLTEWEDYRDVRRLGRKTRLPQAQREVLWSVFDRVERRLVEQNLVTEARTFTILTEAVRAANRPPFDFVVVDESQDMGVPQLRFLAALGGDRPNALFFAGDLGQRIFQQPFSWLALGVDIRGRARTLRVNYRTSHQIRAQADRLLGPEVADVDGNVEDRRGTVSVFNGPPPIVEVFQSAEEEQEGVSDYLILVSADDTQPHEIGVFVRSDAELARAKVAVESAGLPFVTLDERVETVGGKVAVGTMHLAKGLEFRTVVVMACDDEVIPSQARIETVADEADLEDVYNTERQLLYVACTRARDHLLVTAVDPASEFLEDLYMK